MINPTISSTQQTPFLGAYRVRTPVNNAEFSIFSVASLVLFCLSIPISYVPFMNQLAFTLSLVGLSLSGCSFPIIAKYGQRGATLSKDMLLLNLGCFLLTVTLMAYYSTFSWKE